MVERTLLGYTFRLTLTAWGGELDVFECGQYVGGLMGAGLTTLRAAVKRWHGFVGWKREGE